MSQPVSLYFEETGSGPALVLLHGFPLDHTIWDPVVPQLAERFRVIRPDLRGHGRSPAPEGIYTMDLLAQDVAGLIDRLNLERIFLAGHSMGGYAALAFARAYPHRLEALALVASQAAADSAERRLGRYQEAEKVANQGVSVVADGMAPRLTAHPEMVAPLHRLMIANPATGVIGSLKGMAERPDATEFISQLDLPVLVIAGELDVLIPVERAYSTADKLRRGRLVVIPNSGHMPMMEAPRLTAEALLTL